MRIIIDFDYTLFDVERLRHAMMIVAQEQAGVTEEQFRSTEHAVKHALGFYEPSRHAALLVDDGPKRQRLVDAWMALVDDGQSFLYSDAVPFLRRYLAQDTVLLSFGNEQWQRRKIEGTGVSDLIDHVVITLQPKQEIFPTLVVDDLLVIVNDRGSELDALKQLHPNATAVWLRRPNSPYADEPCHSADMECVNLDIELPFVRHNT